MKKRFDVIGEMTCKVSMVVEADERSSNEEILKKAHEQFTGIKTLTDVEGTVRALYIGGWGEDFCYDPDVSFNRVLGMWEEDL